MKRPQSGRLRTVGMEPLEARRMLTEMIVVTTTADVIDPNDGVISLREAVLTANEDPTLTVVVLIEPGEYNLTIKDASADATAGDLDIAAGSHIRISGQGADLTTINASALYVNSSTRGDRVFDGQTGSTIEIEAVKLTGGNIRWYGGGAVRSREGTVTLTDVVATGNSAWGGGAVEIDGGSLTVLNSDLVGNTGTLHGGATRDLGRGTTSITNSRISNNFAGGVDGYHVSITSSTFDGNGSAGMGGAVTADAHLSIVDSSFTSNRGWRGGAVATVGTFHISDSSFVGNSASEYGGAIFSSATGVINDSHFERNKVTTVSTDEVFPSGGAIYNYGDLSIVRGTFHRNQAQSAGGAIANLNKLAIVSSSFTNNTAAQGGALHNNGSGYPDNNLTASDSVFNLNTAGAGAAIFTRSGKLEIDLGTLTNNTAMYEGGGAISSYGTAGQVWIKRSTLADNVALYSDGGAIHNEQAVVNVVDSTITGNRAATGGGVKSEQGTVRVSNSTVSRNVAEVFGGGMEIYGALVIRNSTVIENQSTYQYGTDAGAGILIDQGALATFQNSIVAGNKQVVNGVETPQDILVNDGVLTASSTFNLIGDPATSGGIVHGVGGNLVGDGLGGGLNLAAVLDVELADNGGPTRTHKLIAGSVAINAGDPAFHPGSGNPPLPFDQRGTEHLRVLWGRVDLGAYEYTPPSPARVMNLNVFYNNSHWDGNDPAINSLDEAAIAPNRSPYRGRLGPAYYYNITNYHRGINGIMIDVMYLPQSVTAADFQFKVGNNNAPESWAEAPVPSAVQVVPLNVGIDRIVITWPDGAIRNTWLEVQILANENTGFESPFAFYWGNKVADSGTGTPAHAFVTTPADSLQIYSFVTSHAEIWDRHDYDRDGQVTSSDALLIFSNAGSIVRLNLPAPVAAMAQTVALAEPLRTESGVASALALAPSSSAAPELSNEVVRGTEIPVASAAPVASTVRDVSVRQLDAVLVGLSLELEAELDESLLELLAG